MKPCPSKNQLEDPRRSQDYMVSCRSGLKGQVIYIKGCIRRITPVTIPAAMLAKENRGLPVFALALAMLQREAVETV
jgi:hypothetical protein